jgi:pimeloyl-ACP methyl ester carboxylesterase
MYSFPQSLAVRQFLLTNLIRDEDSKTNALKFRVPLSILGPALDEMAEFPFGDDATAQYTGPTLFVRGLRSHYVGDKNLPAIKKFFPNAEIVDVDAGHWVISEKPEEFRQGTFPSSFRGIDVDC